MMQIAKNSSTLNKEEIGLFLGACDVLQVSVFDVYTVQRLKRWSIGWRLDDRGPPFE